MRSLFAMRPLTFAALAVSTFLAGCSSCDPEGPAVPFGLDAGRPGASPDRAGPAPAAPSARPAGRSLPDGTHRVDLEGAPLLVEGSIRALFADDLDADGDRDAIFLESGPSTAPVRVLAAQRDGAAFAAPRVLATALPLPEGCVVETASLAPLGARFLLARITHACAADPGAAREDLYVLETDRAPRVLEHLAVLAEPERAPGAITLTLAAEDRDADGREDLVATLTVGTATLTLPWLDRPSGLARDAAEPEHTFAERSVQALRLLRRQPAPALSASREVLALWAAVCREPGRARLRVGATDGLSCGRSDGAGRAATTVVRALGAQGELLAALDALAALDQDGLAIDAERRDYARRALAEAPATSGVSLREGPPHLAPGWAGARLPALGFLDEDRVLLRGEAPRVWDLASGETTDAPPAEGELRLLDPSGAYALARIERTCEGHVLSIVAQQGLLSGNVIGAVHARPLLVPRAPPTGASCPELTAALRADDGGWRALGWAPQGVVAARGAELRVVPLDVSARPAGRPSLLEPGTLPPAPLAAGTASRDGRFVAEVRGLGVLVHRIAPDPETSVLWPEGWAAREGDPSEATVSPSGRRVAVLRGGRVLLLERAGAN